MFLLAGLAVSGCLSGPAITPPAPRKPPLIVRLCGAEVPATEDAVRAVVLRHVGPGWPIEMAQARMKQLGFRCLYGGMLREKPKKYLPARTLPDLVVGRDAERDKSWHSLHCTLSANEVGTWGAHYCPLTVKLPYDEAGRVTGVEVERLWQRTSPHIYFFQRRPELREPNGLPVEQAWAILRDHRFFCADNRPQGPGQGRSFLDCHAYCESPLGGSILRIHLYYDETRTVTETEVVQEPEFWDGFQCTLPNESDTTTGAVVKTVLFPVRLCGAMVVGSFLASLMH